MEPGRAGLGRRTFLAGAIAGGAALAMPASLQAQSLGGVLGLGDILGRASDSALDRLAQPNAFYDDQDIRIGLPMLDAVTGNGGGGLLSRLFGATRDLGVADGLVRKLNDAAGYAAGEAKPIFRDAIDDLDLTDVPGILREDTGATQYLRRSSSPRLHDRLNPLVDYALQDIGAFGELDALNDRHSWLRALGISRDGLTRTVTDQGLDGIFTYIGREESNLRRNPLDAAGSLLKGLGL